MSDDDRTELFLQLLAQHERRLAAYVMTFVSSPADVDDILQETKIRLWRNFDTFETGTNFGAWARTTAFYRMKQFYRDRGKGSKRMVFSDDLLERLAEAFEQDAEQRDDRIERLSDCVAKLSANHQQILTLRYGDELVVEELAERIDRTKTATYRVLSRIRLALRDCILGDSASDSNGNLIPDSEPTR